jgi:hypothetical protein
VAVVAAAHQQLTLVQQVGRQLLAQFRLLVEQAVGRVILLAALVVPEALVPVRLQST